MNERKIVRYHPGYQEGLSKKQVDDRKESGLVNINVESKTKEVKDIVRENVITLFNIINFTLAVAVLLVGSFKNLLFMGIIVVNTVISIFQELRSKKTLDKLKVVSSVKMKVVRDKQEYLEDIYNLVLDDIIVMNTGSQVVVDSIIKEGEVLVNESFITGESDNVYKKTGDLLLSGSYIVSGKVYAKVEHVGYDNYTAKLAKDTKYIKPVSSEIMRSLNKIVKTISYFIVPIAILLFSRQMYLEGNTLQNAVVNTVAALIGMIPEGLVLLTSTVLAVSVIRLSKQKVLVQDLYCIETLARVDTICLDKTGTITEGNMEVVKTVDKTDVDTEKVIATITHVLEDENPTALAVKEKYKETLDYKVLDKVPFSSEKKYSGVLFEEVGFYLMGAYEFIAKKEDKKILEEMNNYSKDYRVISVFHAKDKKLTSLTLIGFVLLQDCIRKEAPATLKYFKDQGVTVKIISGDNPETVLNIAKRAGLKEDVKAIDASTLKTNKDIMKAVTTHDVFGRVTPEQKKKFVIALQMKNHVVAMTGDGVNDVLALKEADCSVAMASGSDATKHVSQLVLLDSNFSSMPHIVDEGRRTINNIQRSASLFLVKTIYASLLAVIFIFVEMPYPFIPIQLSLASVVTIGIPSFVLALEPNHERIRGRFLPNVLKRSFPAALTIILNILVIYVVSSFANLTTAQISTLSVTMTGYTSFILLYKTCEPLNILRMILVVTMFLGFVIGILFFPSLFSFSEFGFIMILITILCVAMSHGIYRLIEETMDKIIVYIHKKKQEKD